MLEVPEDPRERHRLFKTIDDAFKDGDFDGLTRVLGAGWVDEDMPGELGLGHPLEYAIYWSPVPFIASLIDAGSNPNYVDDAGFPSLIAALSTSRRSDKLEIVQLLIDRGADLAMRGINDWTPLHYAASAGDLAAVQLLLKAGADPQLRSRIDNLGTPQDEAEAAGFTEIEALLAQARPPEQERP